MDGELCAAIENVVGVILDLQRRLEDPVQDPDDQRDDHENEDDVADPPEDHDLTAPLPARSAPSATRGRVAAISSIAQLAWSMLERTARSCFSTARAPQPTS